MIIPRSVRIVGKKKKIEKAAHQTRRRSNLPLYHVFDIYLITSLFVTLSTLDVICGFVIKRESWASAEDT